MSVAGLAGTAGLVAWSTLNRPKEAYLTTEVNQGFNLQQSSKIFVPRPSIEEGLRDAVASPSSLSAVSPRPIAMAEYATSGVLPPKPAEAPAAEAKPVVTITSKMLSRIRTSRAFRTMMSKPASMMMSQTSLRSGAEMRRFLAEPKRVDAYMNSSMMRVALNSPAFAKAVLTNETLVRSFLGSPAMEDPATLRAILQSPMFRKIMDCPGIQQALADPAVIQSMVGTPEAGMFIAQNPGFARALASAAPAMASAFSR